MKRTKLLTILLLLLTLMSSMFVLSSCRSRGDNSGDNSSQTSIIPTKLTTPMVELNEDTALWNANTNAEKFEISLDGDLSYVENTVSSRKLADGQTFKIRAIGDGTNYSNSDWSNAVTYIKPISKYTITWKNGDTVLETDSDVSEGTVPTYDGAEPTKNADAQYSYKFAGWSPEVVEANADITYTAVFTSVVNKYTVTWKNGDNTLEIDENVEYGTMPSYNGAEPQKEADAQFVYVFSGWSPVVSEVVGNVTYQAQFASAPNSYTIVWKNGDDVLETDENVAYGSTPSYDGATPTKDATAQYTYTFNGWTPQISSVTQSITYTAQFAETLRSYTITFYSEDGLTVLDTVSVEYGSNATYSKSEPVKNASAEYTYVFEKWVTAQGGSVADDLTNVIGDRSVYACFKEFVRKVTVYIVPNNIDYGSVSVSTLNNVPYGAEITVDGNMVTINGQIVTANANTATAQYSYTFASWTADETVGNDTIITANFSRSINSYTITWKNGDKVLEVDENVAYGVTPVYNGEIPTRESDAEFVYTFTGWSPAVTSVVGDATYVAQFDNAQNKHTVIFYDDDGVTELGRVLVAHGEVATYPNDLPSKAPTNALTFTFEKWVTINGGDTEASLENIIEDKSVYAKYAATHAYVVTFCDWDGTVLDEQVVECGNSAIAPQIGYREGYRFVGWDVSFEHIQGELSVRAQYIRVFIVTFLDYDGSYISVEEVVAVENGIASIDAPANNPTRTDFVFEGWYLNDVKLKPNFNIDVISDLFIEARYIREYTVTFLDFDGSIIDTKKVLSGSNVSYPQHPVREGYSFKQGSAGWNKLASNIQEDTTIMALYEINYYEVKFLSPDNKVLKTEYVAWNHYAEAPTDINEMFFTWNKNIAGYYNNTAYCDPEWDKTFDNITEDTVVKLVYKTIVTDTVLVMSDYTITSKELIDGKKANAIFYIYSSDETVNGLNIELSYKMYNEQGQQINYISLDDSSNDETKDNYASITNHSGYDKNYSANININNQTLQFVWVSNGNGNDLNNGNNAIFTVAFTVEPNTPIGEYPIQILASSYYIDDNAKKIQPVIISGKIIVTD